MTSTGRGSMRVVAVLFVLLCLMYVAECRGGRGGSRIRGGYRSSRYRGGSSGSHGHGGASAGMVVGIIFGAIGGIIALVVIFFVCRAFCCNNSSSSVSSGAIYTTSNHSATESPPKYSPPASDSYNTTQNDYGHQYKSQFNQDITPSSDGYYAPPAAYPPVSPPSYDDSVGEGSLPYSANPTAQQPGNAATATAPIGFKSGY